MRIILFFILISCTVSLAQVQLKIQYIGKSNSTSFELYKYTEFITNSTEKSVDDFSLISSNPKQVILDLTKPSRLLVKDKLRSRKFYVQPGNKYEIIIDDDSIYIESDDKINTDMNAIDEKTNGYYNKIYYIQHGDSRKKREQIINRLSEMLALRTDFEGSEYQNKLIKYKLAKLESQTYQVLSNKKAFNKIESDLIENQEVLYNNPEYIEFLFQYYFTRFQSYQLRAKKYPSDLPTLEIMKSETAAISNMEVQQLVLLNFLNQSYNANWVSDNSVVKKELDSLGQHSINRNVKEASQIILNRINQIQVDLQVPDILLTDLTNKEVKLSDFHGKYVLLDFWYIGCRPCQAALPTKKKIYDEFENCIELVSVNNYNAIGDISNYKSKENLPWTFLTLDRNDSALKTLNIRSYPTYYLLDPNGQIVLTPKNHVRGDENLELIERKLQEVCMQ